MRAIAEFTAIQPKLIVYLLQPVKVTLIRESG